MGLPYGNREELTTQPYYVSSYVFVFKKSRNYDIKSMDSPILRKIKIGLEGDTPVEDGVKIRGMLDRTTIFDVATRVGSRRRRCSTRSTRGKSTCSSRGSRRSASS